MSFRFHFTRSQSLTIQVLNIPDGILISIYLEATLTQRTNVVVADNQNWVETTATDVALSRTGTSLKGLQNYSFCSKEVGYNHHYLTVIKGCFNENSCDINLVGCTETKHF